MEIITKNSEETFRLGEKFGSSLTQPSPRLRRARIIAFMGELGAGKTTFIQGLAKGLGIKNKITSPTFILMRTYDRFSHLDLYRLEGDIENEVRNLGLFDIMGKENNIVAIEWAEKIKNVLPKETVWINFENMNENERKITIL